MTQLEMLIETLTAIGVPTTCRKSGDYAYLFIGKPEDAACVTGVRDNFEHTSLRTLFKRHNCFEFEGGQLVSWSAS